MFQNINGEYYETLVERPKRNKTRKPKYNNTDRAPRAASTEPQQITNSRVVKPSGTPRKATQQSKFTIMMELVGGIQRQVG